MTTQTSKVAIVTGASRGIGAVIAKQLAGEGFAVAINYANSAARTAQQLMADVLTINNASIGWDVDWGITDWLVPAGVWTHQGPYISAVLDIASAVGAYVQPHDTAATLRILPRYPAAPWAC